MLGIEGWERVSKGILGGGTSDQKARDWSSRVQPERGLRAAWLREDEGTGGHWEMLWGPVSQRL